MRGARARVLLALVAGAGLGPGCTALFPYPAEPVEQCANGHDDDRDHLTDADDPDCAVYGASCMDREVECHARGLTCNAEGVCAASCTDTTCPAGWTCGTDRACACTPCVERCNSRDDDCDGRVDETTCAAGEACTNGTCTCEGTPYYLAGGALDLLVVLDNSPSMSGDQARLRGDLEAALRAFATGDMDADGVRDFAPLDSIHVGVAVTDLGDDALGLPSCQPGLGDDGVLGAGTLCPDMHVLAFDARRDVPATFAAAADCAFTSVSGCGISQPLDAALKAISPPAGMAWTATDYTPPTFRDMTSGHGGDGGFPREGSVLAVVVVTDADDCSVPSTSLFDPASAEFGGVDLQARCWSFPDQLQAVERYVRGFLALRRDPRDLIFGAITGIPPGSGTMPPEELLARQDMRQVTDPASPSRRLVPVCTRMRTGSPNALPADPARRIVEVAQGIECGGGEIALSSICEDDARGTFAAIFRALADASDRRVCVHASP